MKNLVPKLAILLIAVLFSFLFIKCGNTFTDPVIENQLRSWERRMDSLQNINRVLDGYPESKSINIIKDWWWTNFNLHDRTNDSCIWLNNQYMENINRKR